MVQLRLVEGDNFKFKCSKPSWFFIALAVYDFASCSKLPELLSSHIATLSHGLYNFLATTQNIRMVAQSKEGLSSAHVSVYVGSLLGLPAYANQDFHPFEVGVLVADISGKDLFIG